jgi:hypothetical protein
LRRAVDPRGGCRLSALRGVLLLNVASICRLRVNAAGRVSAAGRCFGKRDCCPLCRLDVGLVVQDRLNRRLACWYSLPTPRHCLEAVLCGCPDDRGVLCLHQCSPCS